MFDAVRRLFGQRFGNGRLDFRAILRMDRPPKGFIARIDEPVGLLDVAPTLLQFLGIPRPAEFQGRGLLDLATSKASTSPSEVYSESLYARNHFGCSSLRSLRLGRYKYIEASKPE